MIIKSTLTFSFHFRYHPSRIFISEQDSIKLLPFFAKTFWFFWPVCAKLILLSTCAKIVKTFYSLAREVKREMAYQLSIDWKESVSKFFGIWYCLFSIPPISLEISWKPGKPNPRWSPIRLPPLLSVSKYGQDTARFIKLRSSRL